MCTKLLSHSVCCSWLAFVCLFLQSCNQKAEPPVPYGAFPDKYQIEWQKLEYYMFIHFGPNTFTNVEWGDGKEDPKVFNPTDLDCRQWAATAKAAGMKGIIITAKHHDGFCLWPSQYSTHTVRESLWKDGKGDVLRELSEACKEYDLLMGVYLSPWDQNHPTYGTDEYNQIFANTLTEVLTGYGHIFEQWFDGANGEGPNGKRQVYDWDLFHETVYSNQPHAIIFSDIGPGARWMGNESGVAGETNWSTLNIKGFGRGHDAPSTEVLNKGNVNGEAWVPAETDVSIRPGWFYSPETDNRVKTLEHLTDIYYTSIGRNSNLLLNVPPDRRGRIHPNDSTRLMEFKEITERSFAENLATNASVTASNIRGNSKQYKADHLLNEEFDSYWTVNDDVLAPSFELSWKSPQTFNRLQLQEYIPLGQRVAGFEVEYWDLNGNKWESLAKETTIGYKRILRFPMITTTKIKVSITDVLACPVLNGVGVFKAPEFLSAPSIIRDKEGMVKINCTSPDPVIYYTTDGSEPTLSSLRYTGAFSLKNAGIVKAMATINQNNEKSSLVTENFDISAALWEILSPEVEDNYLMLDGKTETGLRVSTNKPIIINLGETVSLKGFAYTPVNHTSAPNIVRYHFYVSTDGKEWKKATSPEIFNNIKNNPVRQNVLFTDIYQAGYIKLEPIEVVNNHNEYTIAEISVITAP